MNELILHWVNFGTISLKWKYVAQIHAQIQIPPLRY